MYNKIKQIGLLCRGIGPTKIIIELQSIGHHNHRSISPFRSAARSILQNLVLSTYIALLIYVDLCRHARNQLTPLRLAR